MSGQIVSILIAAESGAPQNAHAQAELEAGIGLVGDRHAGNGIVSIIEREGIDAFNADTGLSVIDERFRRNIVTQGIALNDLVGKRFKIGDAELEGTELCEPCASLGEQLQTDTVSMADVVRLLAHSAGIRARVITGAVIEPGAEVS